MKHTWSLDLGTTNTAVASWDSETDRPLMLHIPGVCRDTTQSASIDLKYTIPSCLFLLNKGSWKDRLGRWPFFQKHFFIGQQALIGQEALDRDEYFHHNAFVSSFKPYLLRDSYRTIAQTKYGNISAGIAAQVFLRELLRHITKLKGSRPRKIVVGTPVDSYEPYRARLIEIGRLLGIKNLQFIDEPVAASLGYGLSISAPEIVLVIDVGGGTLDVALVQLEEKSVERGTCRVLAKEGANVGGNLVDTWMVQEFCDKRGYALNRHALQSDQTFWYRAMLEEAKRVKESLFFQENEAFCLVPPEDMMDFDKRLYMKNKGIDEPWDYTRDMLVQLLQRKKLYQTFEQCIESCLRQAQQKEISPQHISEVLMVGGSTLLPLIYHRVEARFGRDRVRAWQPFNAVAYGGAAFAAEHFARHDFITHDYAFVTYDPEKLKPQYNIVIPKGTPYPTSANYWKKLVVPTCALGEPESLFKLLICEIGSKQVYEQEFAFDAEGEVHTINENSENDENRLVVPLNESNPTLGFLDPPHEPDDRNARLEVTFGVDEHRWLITTVKDLKTRQILLNKEPVVRLK